MRRRGDIIVYLYVFLSLRSSYYYLPTAAHVALQRTTTTRLAGACGSTPSGLLFIASPSSVLCTLSVYLSHALHLICFYLPLFTHLLINRKPCRLPLLYLDKSTPINVHRHHRRKCASRVLSNHATTPIKELSKAPEGEGCPRCGISVYAAEKMMARERVN